MRKKMEQTAPAECEERGQTIGEDEARLGGEVLKEQWDRTRCQGDRARVAGCGVGLGAREVRGNRALKA